MNHPIRYEYQQHIFDNYWNVKKFEQEHQVFVPFVTDYKLYEHALVDKNIDLEHNYDLDYLQFLRNTKSYIRLFYSGGSDSHHILTTAVKNKIYIDEIVVVTRNLYNKEILQPCDVEIVKHAIPFLNTLSSAQVGKVTFKNFDAEHMRNLYKSPDWMFKVPGGDIGFRILQYYDIDDQAVTPADCQIFGTEKPSMVFYKNRWFATVIDAQLMPSAFAQNVCSFYLMPENIKSYLVKAINFKNKILSTEPLFDKSFYFFSSLKYYDVDIHLGKYKSNKFLNGKDRFALQEAIDKEDFDLLSKWHRSLEYLVSVFPDIKNRNSYHRAPHGKFLWFIDLETFEIFSQQELIPNGFEL
jgi:hypothetical protein